MLIGDAVLVDINGKFTPDKVTDISSSNIKGDYSYALQLKVTFFQLIFLVDHSYLILKSEYI